MQMVQSLRVHECGRLLCKGKENPGPVMNCFAEFVILSFNSVSLYLGCFTFRAVRETPFR